MHVFYKGIAALLLSTGLAACSTAPKAPVPAPAPVSTKGQFINEAMASLLGGPLGKTVGKELDRGDLDYYLKASQNALETTKTGTTSNWRNPASGAYGSISLIRTYQADGKYCREYTQTINISGRTDEGYGKACREADATWKVVAAY